MRGNSVRYTFLLGLQSQKPQIQRDRNRLPPRRLSGPLTVLAGQMGISRGCKIAREAGRLGMHPTSIAPPAQDTKILFAANVLDERDCPAAGIIWRYVNKPSRRAFAQDAMRDKEMSPNREP